MKIEILSLFPGYFKGPFEESIIGRARGSGLLDINLIDLRQWGEGPHKRVDDKTLGGGTGMVMMGGPIRAALNSLRTESSKVVYLTPQGEPLTNRVAEALSHCSHLILLCGHYEGVDQRVIDESVDLEVSIGDYVLTNGCLPAIVLVDAVARFIPGVLKEAAVRHDSFQNEIFDWPHYTLPREDESGAVPEVLLSGNHERIARWRHSAALLKTALQRPELVMRYMAGPLREGMTLYCFVSDRTRSERFYRRYFPVKEGRMRVGEVEIELVEGLAEGRSMPLFFRLGLPAKEFPWRGQRLTIEDPDGHYWSIERHPSNEEVDEPQSDN